jgi:hypothetical protein
MAGFYFYRINFCMLITICENVIGLSNYEFVLYLIGV